MVDLTYPSLFQNQIFTMAAATPKDLVTTVCDKVLSLTSSQRYSIVNNDWDRLADFRGFNYDRIQTWAREINRLPESRGGCYFISVATSKIQGLAYWENQMLLSWNTLVCGGFGAAMM